MSQRSITRPSRAHPRSRGENWRDGGVNVSSRGSSPLTRGKLPDVNSLGPHLGLIPAHAGKTSGRGGQTCPPAAHPRSRGENERGRSMVSVQSGSSPLTRGKRPSQRGKPRERRLIPAHAGKTYTSQKLGIILTAHPRSRGENLAHTTRGEYFKGSSPLTRGKPRRRCQRKLRRGLIPAHAGKTSVVRWAIPSRWAHPRSRGENKFLSRVTFMSAGSSPLTRGKRFCIRPEDRVEGLIPAHAGKTS